MGFSQGAMMSLAVAMAHPGIAAGVVSMSGRAVPHLLALIPDKEALTGLPIFVAHGTLDPLLPIENGRQTREALMSLPVDLTYREYRMAHEISVESLRDITAWLKDRLDRSFK
jgi:phospholipase/carboxylesterase